MSVRTRLIEYDDGGTCLEGFLAYDDANRLPLPGILVSHAWRGRDEFACEKAQNLAALGYAGFALDIYGKGVEGAGNDECARLMQPFMDDREMLQRRITLALDTLRKAEEVDANQIAAIGFCFGGLCVLDLARTGADIRGVASFHGLLSTPGNTQGNKIKAKVLVLHGHEDPMVPSDEVSALQRDLTQAGADWQFHSYGNTMHAFTNPFANDPDFGTVYNESAHRRSWLSLETFLNEIMA